ncbi:hypothetical protein FGSG_05479 [Fusarium graminearum PH-1]|uniref:Transcription factor domain-containing protein n=1 Tax=Gibberella zeae (strain ATCC MYA-4620 / CBS 123657 / FGSC 9075 / NRRL 31084 / PH-1) TaxID=229533 RepID=I1RNB1_GIBZE|nr:hypothetical protein FGSG_05479 [Fusarium graminearum PH-1]ESU11445.1 hypothetical protein FGSG_05479 [Fusarium graminearum PH-1]|eukprot:XP_011324021.1 hypothetical protein FGSG_05479 [Fusarium graminearum PH-1]
MWLASVVVIQNKLELLEQELRSIKEVVHPKNNVEPVSVSQSHTAVFHTPTHSANNTVFPLSNHLQSSQQSESFTPSAPLLHKTEPTKSRVINGQVVSGKDIDWYFEKYAKNGQIVTSLLDTLNRDVWGLLRAVALDMETIHVLLIICSWPFPTIRFVTDPSPTFVSSALNACMLLGLHTGRGSHPSFLIGGRQHMTCTDYEASITWMFCCILAQSVDRTAVGNGHPPPFLQHNDTGCRNIVKDTLAPELMTLFELQKFSNRLHTAMTAQILSNDGVPETVVKTWEDEFELLRPLVTHVDTDCSRLIILTAQLEVQAYYFVSLPDQRPNFTINTLRAYNTSQNLINTALTLESTSRLLTHSTHWIYRAVMDACCILMSTLHSKAAPPHISASDADAVVAQILTVLRTCSVRDNDLPFKQALQEAKNSTDSVQKGIDVYEANISNADKSNGDSVVTNPDINQGQDQTIDNSIDPLQGVDWSMIIDDFGWIGEGPVFLGPA